jgi:hypothetical protein
VQSQPSAQLSQQPWSQLQSGQPSQQALALLQQPPPQLASEGAPANASELANKAPTAARDQRDLVNMMKLTFWLKLNGETN